MMRPDMRFQSLPEIDFQHGAIADILGLQSLREHRHGSSLVSGELTPMMAPNQTVESSRQGFQDFCELFYVMLGGSVNTLRFVVISGPDFHCRALSPGWAFEIRIVAHADDAGFDSVRPLDVSFQAIHFGFRVLDVS